MVEMPNTPSKAGNGGLTSPNQMMEEAKKQMLDGRDPKTHGDYELIMNFFAFNIHHEAASTACHLIAQLYSMPLSESEVDEIVAFQTKRSH